MKKKLIELILFFLISFQACASNSIYEKKEDLENNRIIFLDQSGKTVYEITEEMGLIYNSIFLTNAKVYYIDNSYNLVEVNLENSQMFN